MTIEEQLIYQTIEDAGSHGALPSSFKQVVTLSQPKINAIVNQLKKKGLIKSLNSIARGNRKVWMLIETEPSQEVTGGLTGAQNFDIERVQVVCDRVESYTRKQGRVSHRELLIFIKQIGIMPADQLRDEDIN